jgi:hypothetical protein
MLLPPKKKNRRHPPAVREQRQARREKPDVARNPARMSEREHLGLKKWIGILFLAPIAFITILTLFEMGWRLVTRHGIWQTEEFRFFGLGLLVWTLMFGVARIRPVRLYVFGHELSHALVALCSGGKIYKFEFNAQGGYVETNKTNTWISLAPYLIPLYSLFVMMIFGIAAHFTDLHTTHQFSIFGQAIPFKFDRLFYICLGLTWAFHITYTILALRAEQSDLTRNGEFFSIMLIAVINAALLMLMFVSASPHPELGLAQTFRCWWGVATSLIPWSV